MLYQIQGHKNGVCPMYYLDHICIELTIKLMISFPFYSAAKEILGEYFSSVVHLLKQKLRKIAIISVLPKKKKKNIKHFSISRWKTKDCFSNS